SASPGTDIKDLNSIKEKIRGYGLDVALRVNFEPRNRLELLKFLRKNRMRFEVIGVKPLTNELATLSARDRRVDLLYYDFNNWKITFRESTAHVCTSALEVPIRPLIASSTQGSIHALLTRLRKEVEVALEHDIPVVITSAARGLSEIRAARDMAALARCLGLKERNSLDVVSKNPMEIISRNRLKLNRKYVMEGIQLDLGGTQP
ncbi:MAG: RNase P subunit p30 family protein, partial [Candidatus Bathyarchaeia archaeon]